MVSFLNQVSRPLKCEYRNSLKFEIVSGQNTARTDKSNDHFPSVAPIWQHRENFGVTQPQLDGDINVSEFPYFKQRSQSESSTVNTSTDIQFDGTITIPETMLTS